MLRALRLAGPLAALAIGAAALAGCTAPGLILTAAGIATDTSMTWEMVKHVHAPAHRGRSDAVRDAQQRAARAQRPLRVRRRQHPRRRHRQERPAGVPARRAATRDARLWRALPELIEKGAGYERCARSPLQDLAEIDACPNFQAAPRRRSCKAIVYLADNDPRSVRHDVFRMLSCRNARAPSASTRCSSAGSIAASCSPARCRSARSRRSIPRCWCRASAASCEVAGHSPQRCARPLRRQPAGGFEEALRTSHWAALEWWFYELPQLANRAPPSRGAQMAWVPLQRVLLPGYLVNPDTQADTVRFLMAHGADPRIKLPFDQGKNVITFAAADQEPDGRACSTRPPRSAVPAPRRRWRRARPAPKAAARAGARRGRRARRRASIRKSPTSDTTPR